MDQRPPPTTLALAAAYVSCYALWLGLCGLGLWVLLRLRTHLLVLLLIVKTGPWVLWAADKLGVLLLGVVGVVLAVLIEHYLRTGVEQEELTVRTAQLFLAELLLLGLSFGFQLLVG